MNNIDVDAFVAEWEEAWRTRDIDRLLTHFADDAVFSSPVAALIVEGSDGIGLVAEGHGTHLTI